MCSRQLFRSLKSQISNRKYNCRFLDITFLIGDAFKLYCIQVVFKSTNNCPSKFKFLLSTKKQADDSNREKDFFNPVNNIPIL